MHRLKILLLVATVVAYPQELDESLLIDIFGTPPTTVTSAGPTTQRLEDMTIRTTDSTSTFTEATGEKCQCVPYYLCDAKLNGVWVNNASVTGWGDLDIRFGEEDCQESVERCCKRPKTEDEVTIKPKPSPKQGCGYRYREGLDFSVKGGSGAEAQFGEFPWVVALIDAKNESYAGVGVLIHPGVVMTGAHIAFKYGPGALKIRAGEWDTQTVKERLQYQERQVTEVVIHDGFNSKNLRNDIALLRLETPVELADHIRVICMPEQNENFESSKNCVANGWGKDVFGLRGRYAVILKLVEVNMVQHSRCNGLLQRTRLGHKFRLHTSFVCAGGEEGKDTCQGDGGAPLVCPIGGDRYKLSGLVAWGIGCGVKDVPAVYTNVAAFRQWTDAAMARWELERDQYQV